jgi:predicted DCC family thiol-disulfide oxidoreductase YuxK
MQSEKGKIFLLQMGIESLQPGTVIFSDSGKTFKSYQAVARIATYLRFPFNILSFVRFVPPFIGNGFYYLIARNRRRFFGVNESCMMVVKGKEGRFEGDSRQSLVISH